MSHFIFFFQVLFEVFYFLSQKSVHFHLLFDDAFQFINVWINIVVHKTYPLDLWDQFAFLSQKLSVFLDGSHVGSKYFLLFFKNVAHLLLESKKLFVILITHCSLHCIKIILDLSLVFHFGLFLNFDFFIDNILIIRVVFWSSYVFLFQCWVAVCRIFIVVWRNDWLFIGIWSILFLLLWVLFFFFFDLIFLFAAQLLVRILLVDGGWFALNIGRFLSDRIARFWYVSR